MKSRTAKPGRPRKPYRTNWGEHINGLRKRGDASSDPAQAHKDGRR